MRLITFIAKSWFIMWMFTSVSHAESSASGGEQIFATHVIESFSKQVERTLAENKANVALVARSGRDADELPPGVHYTHVGLAVYSEINDSNGNKHHGYVMYNLYQKEVKSDKSILINDFPFDFFRFAKVMKTAIIIPKPQLQMKLLSVIQSDTYQKLHNSSYSAIANPFNRQYQNCTEFVMDIIQAAIYDTSDENDIKQYLKAHFQPYVIPYSKGTVLMGSVFSKDITTRDQSGEHYVTATFGSIRRYFEKYQLHQNIIEISH